MTPTMQGNPGAFAYQNPQTRGLFPQQPEHPLDTINQPPQNFAARLVGLANAHPWMPHQTIATLAALPNTDAEVATMAASLRRAYGSVDNTIHYITDDPLLQKQPSLGLALKMYLTGTIGPWPLQDSDLVHVQKQLQSLGFAKGQKADGVWSSPWNAAYGQYVQNQKTEALGGKTPGSTLVSSALGALGWLFPEQAAHAVVSWAQSIPHQARDDLRTVVGSMGGGALGGAVGGLFPQAKQWSAAAENLIPGPHVTPQTSYMGEGTRAKFLDSASVVGDLLIAHGLFGAGKTIAEAAGESALKGVDMEAALRSPRALAKGVWDTSGNTPGGVLGFVPKTPILRLAGPVVDQTLGKDGLYYRARTLLASPYALPPVRVAGTAMGQLGVAGAKIRGVAAAENAIGGQTSPLQAQLNKYNVVDSLDHAIQNKLAFTVLGHHFRPGINTLVWFLHPPISGSGAISHSIADDLGNGHQALDDMLGPSTGFAVNIERGVNGAHPGKYMTYQDLIDHFGGTANFAKFAIPKIAQHAATHFAEKELSTLSAQDIEAAGGRAEMIKELSHEAYNNPDALVLAAKEMVDNHNPLHGQWGGPDELSKRIAAEILRTADGRRGWLRGNGQNWVKAGDIVRDEVIPRLNEVFHDPVRRGAIGLANLDYKTKDVATQEADAFGQRLAQATRDMNQQEQGFLGDYAEMVGKKVSNKIPRITKDEAAAIRSKGFNDVRALSSEMRDWLNLHFDVATDQMPADHAKLVRLAQTLASKQAAPLFAKAASPQLRQALGDIRKLGYQPVMGNDIGHAFYDQPHIDIFDARLSRLRRMIESIGLSPRNVSSHDVNFGFQHEVLKALEDSIGKGELRLMPYDNARGILARLRAAGVVPASGLMNDLMGSIAAWTHRSELRQVTQALLPEIQAHAEAAGRSSSPAELLADARAIAKRRLGAQMNPTGLLNIRPSQVKEVFGQPVAEGSALAQELEYQMNKEGLQYRPMAPYDIHGQQAIYRAVQHGKANMPWRLTGWQGIENMAGYHLGFAGRALPNSHAAYWIENLPSRYVPLRNQLRFNISPEYSARRLVKANVKAAMDGVPVTWRPYHAMEQRGITEEALALLDRIQPGGKDPVYDEGIQSLNAASIDGIYNPRNQEAYAVWHWNKMGRTDDEIRALLIKDFGYGSARYGEGRTALEKSLNFVFFPFSFDKTLYRNTGQYIIDRPAQQMLLTAGLAAYAKWNAEHPNGDTIGTSSWFQKHVPLMQEAMRLNAFAHGINLGQFGGINAPLLNLFIPQSYNANPKGLQVVQGLIPIWKELNNFGRESIETGKIAGQEIDNLGHGPGTAWMPQPVAETATAQLYDAYSYRRALSTSVLSNYVHWNAHHSNKIKLADNPAKYGQFAGQVIDATMIDQMVNLKYPAFQIDNPSVFYAQQAQAITNYATQMRLSGRGAVTEWITDAQKYGKAIYAGKIDPGEQAVTTKILRNYAVRFAETIPGFLKFYDSNFRWQYGPLEAVTP
jgi:hypothetical protein